MDNFRANGFTPADEEFMRVAIRLAATGEGRVSPNPPVGCVLVKEGRIIARGWHDRLGDLHAEAMALREAGPAAEGATAYVSLSPCTTFGRQPPCSDALIAARVAGVVVGAEDPNPRNSSGVEVLRAAGIPARAGCLAEEAEYAARGFFSMQRRKRPNLLFKYAMTLDGKIAACTGDSRWVSCGSSREQVMDMRSRVDAIMIGSGTMRADNPLLTVREPAWSARGGAARHRQPLRVVVDGGLHTPPSAAMLRDVSGGPVLLACGGDAPPERADALRWAGAEVVPYPGEGGKVALHSLLADLGGRGVNRVLCEGGGGLGWALLSARLVDEVAVFIAPKLVGGRDAPGPVGGDGLPLMSGAWRVAVREQSRSGDDVFIGGTVIYDDSLDGQGV
ncbi:MAG: bifunctional diaminohydroxyphosphoribosylaminopyrimidine deaminase/5-amino-6-(5-phosphoribosylamino)uracil reductase RibD [Planctomycetaceae bacterium]|nr:bifunctional diaminohydroxyphosphoribosylaminopyrimidine deaminase/5-amino-6-(5-phosphoribosylamino)uracil reductase RibD [Planctomycetaceae bacterium]